MSLLTAAYVVEPKTQSPLARLGAWLARRPSARQRRATQDIEYMSAHMQRDLGFELFIHSERRP